MARPAPDVGTQEDDRDRRFKHYDQAPHGKLILSSISNPTIRVRLDFSKLSQSLNVNALQNCLFRFAQGLELLLLLI